jgi:flagellar L-ring protein precursor FlgH
VIAMTRFARVLLLLPLAACATYVEDKAGLDFAPVYADQAEFAPVATGSIFHEGARGLFVNDRRAAGIGDVLTVQFSERFQASKSQSTNAGRSSSFEMELPGILAGGLDSALLSNSSAESFSGRGGAAQSNSFTGRLSVSVLRVLPNGHLEVMGQKRLTLNNGNEYVRLTGVVRPEDIGPDNVVSSDRIAHADIRYIGAGDTADTARRGWLSRAVTAVNPL